LTDKTKDEYEFGRFVGRVETSLENIEKMLSGFVGRFTGYDERLRRLETVKNGSRRSVMAYGGGSAAAVIAIVEAIKLLAA